MHMYCILKILKLKYTVYVFSNTFGINYTDKSKRYCFWDIDLMPVEFVYIFLPQGISYGPEIKQEPWDKLGNSSGVN